MSNMVKPSRLVQLGAIRTAPLSKQQRAAAIQLAERLRCRANVRLSSSRLYPLHTVPTLIETYHAEEAKKGR